ncbi:low temperature requirement protein A [Polymorphospora sp. NPDC051019]|uniref:low temperature requirement protein A n=1 Tax=Polymorphospora sp. NPDC051019 TaxID=3155725 RepID=UPI003447A31B
MTGGGDRADLLRGDVRQVTPMELFFDLVYVFAVTQLTDLLLADLTPAGALRTLLLLVVVWWAWVDTAWVTNWFDPGRATVRLMLVAVMLLALVMSATLPQAYGDRGWWFAGAYVAMQVGRSTFAAVESRGRPDLRRNFQRITVWRAASGVLWLAGAFADGPSRVALWTVAVVGEYFAAASGFWIPGWGRSTPADWRISGRHLAERCQLFIIIALGESILVTGAAFAGLRFGPAAVAAFAAAFLGSVALWWVYFGRVAEAAGGVIDRVREPGRLGRSAYTYGHLPIVAGVIVTAVGDKLTLAGPTGRSDLAVVVTVLGGPALFLAGHALFKRVVFGHPSRDRLVAVAVLVLLAPLGLLVPPLPLSLLATLVLAGVAVWDTRLAGVRAGGR